MLKWKFWERAEPVCVDINEIYQRFALYNDRYKHDPAIHMLVMNKFGQVSLRGGSFTYGPGRVFYSDPQKVLTIKAPEKQFLDEPDPEDEHIQSSACIAFTEAPRAFGKRAFGMIIRQDSHDFDSLYDNSIIFGIYGEYDKNGRMAVKKLLAPGKDGTQRLTETKEIPITPENVEGALRYAEICVQTITRKSPLNPRTCLEQSMRPEKAGEGIKVLPPAP